jgi:hypothetical protein
MIKGRKQEVQEENRMTQAVLLHRQRLQVIARQARCNHGFWPDFSAAAIAQVERLTPPAADQDHTLRDLRG